MSRRSGIALPLTAALLLILPGTATAGSVTVSGETLMFNSAGGEANDVLVSLSGSVFTVRDAGAALTPLAPCAPVDGNTATCSSPQIARLELNLGNLNDRGAVDGSVVLPRAIGGASINGGDGDDTLIGAPNEGSSLVGDEVDAGNDTLTGGSQSDGLIPGPGNDVVSGGDGADSISTVSLAPDGADTFNGGRDGDTLDLQRSTDTSVTLNGQADDGASCPGAACEGDNVGADIERVVSGFGDDTLTGSAAPNQFFSGDGNDTLAGGGGPDRLVGGDERDVLRGGPGEDELQGGFDEDTMFGESGDDRMLSFELTDDPDSFSGGSGTDSVSFRDAGGPVRVDLDGRADDGVAGEGDNVRPDVETLIGSFFADVLIGSRRANVLVGLAGDDRLVGRGGADALLGDRGDDRLALGSGRDLADGDAGVDRIASRDKSPDEVLCGSAVDRVTADRRDRLAADCDRVRRR